MSDKKEPGFWRGFAWGAVGLPLLVGAVGLVGTVVVGVAGAIAARKTIDA